MRRWLIAAFFLISTAAIDPAVFECEEAVAHLKHCCGDSVPDVHCGEGCEELQLDINNAKCLREASCDTLRQSGACDNPTGTSCQ
jgi:hypothetical protein